MLNCIVTAVINCCGAAWRARADRHLPVCLQLRPGQTSTFCRRRFFSD